MVVFFKENTQVPPTHRPVRRCLGSWHGSRVQSSPLGQGKGLGHSALTKEGDPGPLPSAKLRLSWGRA